MADGNALASVKTTCPYCGVGCGVIATTHAGGDVSISGDPEHPANFGRLCSKGLNLAETLGREGRLLYPEMRGQRVSWDKALQETADKFTHIIQEYGPDAVAFYVSGQLLTEDYYVANKLMKGFIGSANIDTNSRLCMASSVAGHKRAFGADSVPGNYEDLEQADLIVLVGSNLAWCHPVLYQRILAAKEKRPTMKLVVIDPRQTATSDQAELHLPIAPGTDLSLFMGLFHYLEKNGVVAHPFVDKHTAGFDAAKDYARAYDFNRVLKETELKAGQLQRFYELFAANEKTICVYSQGINQSVTGTDKVNAIINCHLLSGRIGKPGAGPFSVTGQPNAMGGREVGGLANQLTCHMALEDTAHRELVSRFWRTKNIASSAGLKAVDLFEAVAAKKVKAVWIMGTNPVVSMPEAEKVRHALQACEFVVVSDIVRQADTVACADVLLPATGWGEKSGTVTNSERCISRQRSFQAPLQEARADWNIISDVARRMGWHEAFQYTDAADIFAEYAALSGFENDGQRDFDISVKAQINKTDYDGMQPFQWPANVACARGTKRLFTDGKFFTKTGRAQFVIPSEAAQALPHSRNKSQEAAYPLVLNTGRIRDHWHTMTRTGRSATLSQHIVEPYVEINPVDAAANGIEEGDLVEVANDLGAIIVRGVVARRQRRGSVFVPMHWSDAYASNARVDQLVRAATDPISGQPALKSARVKIAKAAPDWSGFLTVTTSCWQAEEFTKAAFYWAAAKSATSKRVEFSGNGSCDEIISIVTKSIRKEHKECEIIEMADRRSGLRRVAYLAGGVAVAMMHISPHGSAIAREWVSEQIGTIVEPVGRLALLAGRPTGAEADKGAIICSCMGVGQNQIAAAIQEGCETIRAVGARTMAGTNCGSCHSEIRTLIEEAHHVELT